MESPRLRHDDSGSHIVQPGPSDEKNPLPPSEIGGEKQTVPEGINIHPERISVFKDYLRVFRYATRFDYVLMIPAVLTSIGAGVVRQLSDPPPPRCLRTKVPGLWSVDSPPNERCVRVRISKHSKGVVPATFDRK